MLELAGIIILGILAQWVAWRLKLPAILPLILIGLLVGPIATLFTQDGGKLIEPIWNGEKGLFPGEGLYYFVSLAISIILFEGGLTLKRSEIRNVGPVITKLITMGTFYFRTQLADILSILGLDHCYRSYGNHSHTAQYSIEERHFGRAKMGGHTYRSHWCACRSTGIRIYQCRRRKSIYANCLDGVWKNIAFRL